MPEVRCEPLAAGQLAASLIDAIELIEDTGADIVEVEFGSRVGGSASAGQVSVPVRTLRSFMAETLKAGEVYLGQDELSLNWAAGRMLLRFCTEGHVHFSADDERLVEGLVANWRASGRKVFERAGSNWVPRI